MNQFEKIDELIKNQNGIVRTAQVIEACTRRQTYYFYVKDRDLEQTAHGNCCLSKFLRGVLDEKLYR